MIESLTPEQEAKLSVYKDEWLKIGLSCEPADKPNAEKYIKEIYKENNLKIPNFAWFDSPFAIIKQFKENYPEEIDNVMKNWIYGNHEAHWLSFYAFFLYECKLEACKKIENFIHASKYCGWWLPCDETCFCSQRPLAIHKNDNNELHCESGPAISYRDGIELYFLNGVKISKDIVMTPAEKLDPKIVLKETNVEIRREIVRKIGVERMLLKLDSEVIDKDQDHAGQPCELVLLKLDDDRRRPYIKLLNPSIGTYHVEGVPQEIKTVKEALAWRNQSDEAPEKLT